MEKTANKDLEIWLSSDGKHTVRIQADIDEATNAYKVASTIYKQILKDHGTGTKVKMVEEANGKTPKCPVHGTVMNLVPAGVSKRTGKRYDAFYACDVDDCTETQKA